MKEEEQQFSAQAGAGANLDQLPVAPNLVSQTPLQQPDPSVVPFDTSKLEFNVPKEQLFGKEIQKGANTQAGQKLEQVFQVVPNTVQSITDFANQQVFPQIVDFGQEFKNNVVEGFSSVGAVAEGAVIGGTALQGNVIDFFDDPIGRAQDRAAESGYEINDVDKFLSVDLTKDNADLVLNQNLIMEKPVTIDDIENLKQRQEDIRQAKQEEDTLNPVQKFTTDYLAKPSIFSDYSSSTTAIRDFATNLPGVGVGIGSMIAGTAALTAVGVPAGLATFIGIAAPSVLTVGGQFIDSIFNARQGYDLNNNLNNKFQQLGITTNNNYSSNIFALQEVIPQSLQLQTQAMMFQESLYAGWRSGKITQEQYISGTKQIENFEVEENKKIFSAAGINLGSGTTKETILELQKSGYEITSINKDLLQSQGSLTTIAQVMNDTFMVNTKGNALATEIQKKAAEETMKLGYILSTNPKKINEIRPGYDDKVRKVFEGKGSGDILNPFIITNLQNNISEDIQKSAQGIALALNTTEQYIINAKKQGIDTSAQEVEFKNMQTKFVKTQEVLQYLGASILDNTLGNGGDLEKAKEIALKDVEKKYGKSLIDLIGSNQALGYGNSDIKTQFLESKEKIAEQLKLKDESVVKKIEGAISFAANKAIFIPVEETLDYLLGFVNDDYGKLQMNFSTTLENNTYGQFVKPALVEAANKLPDVIEAAVLSRGMTTIAGKFMKQNLALDATTMKPYVQGLVRSMADELGYQFNINVNNAGDNDATGFAIGLFLEAGIDAIGIYSKNKSMQMRNNLTAQDYYNNDSYAANSAALIVGNLMKDKGNYTKEEQGIINNVGQMLINDAIETIVGINNTGNPDAINYIKNRIVISKARGIQRQAAMLVQADMNQRIVQMIQTNKYDPNGPISENDFNRIKDKGGQVSLGAVITTNPTYLPTAKKIYEQATNSARPYLNKLRDYANNPNKNVDDVINYMAGPTTSYGQDKKLSLSKQSAGLSFSEMLGYEAGDSRGRILNKINTSPRLGANTKKLYTDIFSSESLYNDKGKLNIEGEILIQVEAYQTKEAFDNEIVRRKFEDLKKHVDELNSKRSNNEKPSKKTVTDKRFDLYSSMFDNSDPINKLGLSGSIEIEGVKYKYTLDNKHLGKDKVLASVIDYNILLPNGKTEKLSFIQPLSGEGKTNQRAFAYKKGSDFVRRIGSEKMKTANIIKNEKTKPATQEETPQQGFVSEIVKDSGITEIIKIEPVNGEYFYHDEKSNYILPYLSNNEYDAKQLLRSALAYGYYYNYYDNLSLESDTTQEYRDKVLLADARVRAMKYTNPFEDSAFEEGVGLPMTMIGSSDYPKIVYVNEVLNIDEKNITEADQRNINLNNAINEYVNRVNHILTNGVADNNFTSAINALANAGYNVETLPFTSDLDVINIYENKKTPTLTQGEVAETNEISELIKDTINDLPFLPVAIKEFSNGEGINEYMINGVTAIKYLSTMFDNFNTSYIEESGKYRMLISFLQKAINNGQIDMLNVLATQYQNAPEIFGSFMMASLTGDPFYKTLFSEVANTDWVNAVSLSDYNNLYFEISKEDNQLDINTIKEYLLRNAYYNAITVADKGYESLKDSFGKNKIRQDSTITEMVKDFYSKNKNNLLVNTAFYDNLPTIFTANLIYTKKLFEVIKKIKGLGAGTQEFKNEVADKADSLYKQMFNKELSQEQYDKFVELDYSNINFETYTKDKLIDLNNKVLQKIFDPEYNEDLNAEEKVALNFVYPIIDSSLDTTISHGEITEAKEAYKIKRALSRYDGITDKVLSYFDNPTNTIQVISEGIEGKTPKEKQFNLMRRQTVIKETLQNKMDLDLSNKEVDKLINSYRLISEFITSSLNDSILPSTQINFDQTIHNRITALYGVGKESTKKTYLASQYQEQVGDEFDVGKNYEGLLDFLTNIFLARAEGKQLTSLFSGDLLQQKKSIGGIEFEFTNDTEIFGRYDRKKNKILLNTNNIKNLFDTKGWTNPKKQSDGSIATALPADAFVSFDEFLTFVVLHERTHTDVFRKTGETIGEYEDRINQLALEKLNSIGISQYVGETLQNARQKNNIIKYYINQDTGLFDTYKISKAFKMLQIYNEPRVIEYTKSGFGLDSEGTESFVDLLKNNPDPLIALEDVTNNLAFKELSTEYPSIIPDVKRALIAVNQINPLNIVIGDKSIFKITPTRQQMINKFDEFGIDFVNDVAPFLTTKDTGIYSISDINYIALGVPASNKIDGFKKAVRKKVYQRMLQNIIYKNNNNVLLEQSSDALFNEQDYRNNIKNLEFLLPGDNYVSIDELGLASALLAPISDVNYKIRKDSKLYFVTNYNTKTYQDSTIYNEINKNSVSLPLKASNIKTKDIDSLTEQSTIIFDKISRDTYSNRASVLKNPNINLVILNPGITIDPNTPYLRVMGNSIGRFEAYINALNKLGLDQYVIEKIDDKGIMYTTANVETQTRLLEKELYRKGEGLYDSLSLPNSNFVLVSNINVDKADLQEITEQKFTFLNNVAKEYGIDVDLNNVNTLPILKEQLSSIINPTSIEDGIDNAVALLKDHGANVISIPRRDKFNVQDTYYEFVQRYPAESIGVDVEKIVQWYSDNKDNIDFTIGEEQFVDGEIIVIPKDIQKGLVRLYNNGLGNIVNDIKTDSEGIKYTDSDPILQNNYIVNAGNVGATPLIKSLRILDLIDYHAQGLGEQQGSLVNKFLARKYLGTEASGVDVGVFTMNDLIRELKDTPDKKIYNRLKKVYYDNYPKSSFVFPSYDSIKNNRDTFIQNLQTSFIANKQAISKINLVKQNIDIYNNGYGSGIVKNSLGEFVEGEVLLSDLIANEAEVLTSQSLREFYEGQSKSLFALSDLQNMYIQLKVQKIQDFLDMVDFKYNPYFRSYIDAIRFNNGIVGLFRMFPKDERVASFEKSFSPVLYTLIQEGKPVELAGLIKTGYSNIIDFPTGYVEKLQYFFDTAIILRNKIVKNPKIIEGILTENYIKQIFNDAIFLRKFATKNDNGRKIVFALANNNSDIIDFIGSPKLSETNLAGKIRSYNIDALDLTVETIKKGPDPDDINFVLSPLGFEMKEQGNKYILFDRSKGKNVLTANSYYDKNDFEFIDFKDKDRKIVEAKSFIGKTVEYIEDNIYNQEVRDDSSKASGVENVDQYLKKEKKVFNVKYGKQNITFKKSEVASLNIWAAEQNNLLNEENNCIY